ncbi:hypothetical protein, partial [Sphingomonas asaccharolytica]|uniref:hypothetical protein n=1 Tax=Sphingomonas asaccharolytica TaxID=40681 RepID=UPI001C3F6D59
NGGGGARLCQGRYHQRCWPATQSRQSGRDLSQSPISNVSTSNWQDMPPDLGGAKIGLREWLC